MHELPQQSSAFLYTKLIIKQKQKAASSQINKQMNSMKTRHEPFKLWAVPFDFAISPWIASLMRPKISTTVL